MGKYLESLLLKVFGLKLEYYTVHLHWHGSLRLKELTEDRAKGKALKKLVEDLKMLGYDFSSCEVVK